LIAACGGIMRRSGPVADAPMFEDQELLHFRAIVSEDRQGGFFAEKSCMPPTRSRDILKKDDP
jgi:hypothetical protein